MVRIFQRATDFLDLLWRKARFLWGWQSKPPNDIWTEDSLFFFVSFDRSAPLQKLGRSPAMLPYCHHHAPRAKTAHKRNPIHPLWLRSELYNHRWPRSGRILSGPKSHCLQYFKKIQENFPSIHLHWRMQLHGTSMRPLLAANLRLQSRMAKASCTLHPDICGALQSSWNDLQAILPSSHTMPCHYIQ